MPSHATAPVSVHIDVVSIEGLRLTGAQAARFQAAFEQELSRLAGLGNGAFAFEPAAEPFLLAPPLRLGASLQVAELGREIGRRVWAALDRTGHASKGLGA